MGYTKTAVSIEKSLFERAEGLAKRKKISRSRLVGIALEEYLHKQENQELLARINAAYADGLDQTEKKLLKNMKRVHRKQVEGEW